MRKFNIEEYKNWLLQTQIQNKHYKKFDQYIDAICQFKVAPSTYLQDNHSNRGYAKIFGTNYDKIDKAILNDWLLFKYGYKHCNKCDSVKLLDEFQANKTYWHLRSSYCSLCIKKKVNKVKKIFIEDSTEFNLEKWKSYINYCTNNSMPQKYLDSFCQFELKDHNYLNVSNSHLSRTLRSILRKEVLVGKPNTVSIKSYLLFKFGFKYCTGIKQVLSLEQFGKNKTLWNGLSHYSLEYTRLLPKKGKEVVIFSSDRYINRTFPGFEKEIENIYKKSKELTQQTGIPHEVDHVYPINGKNSCGLHVPWNLQILTLDDNRTKHNKIL